MGCRKLSYYEQERGLEKSPLKIFGAPEEKKCEPIFCIDYYPFGLTFNSYQRPNTAEQRWKFQGQEHIDDLGLNWDSFKWRNHQPDIGRFFNVDPLADKYVYNSPYAFSENKVTNAIELEGLEAYVDVATAKFVMYSATIATNRQGNDQRIGSTMMNNYSTPPSGSNNSGSVEPKTAQRMSDVNTVSDNTNKNINVVEKATLEGAKGVGFVMTIAGAGAPMGAAGLVIGIASNWLDEARQVNNEGKPTSDAVTDVLVDGAVDLLTEGTGKTAKNAVETVVEETLIDLHQTGFNSFAKWFVDQYRNRDNNTNQNNNNNQDEEKDDQTNDGGK